MYFIIVYYCCTACIVEAQKNIFISGNWHTSSFYQTICVCVLEEGRIMSVWSEAEQVLLLWLPPFTISSQYLLHWPAAALFRTGESEVFDSFTFSF
jgi:hypothetical protein